MKESTLTNISLGMTIIGLITLFVLLKHAKYPEYKPNPYYYDAIGKDITISGRVTGLRETNSSTILTVSTEGEISAIVNEKKLKIEKGDTVTMNGKVEEYKGRIFFSPKKIKKRLP